MTDTTPPSPESPGGAPARAGFSRVLASLQNPYAIGFALTLGGLTAWLLGMALSSLATILIYIVAALFIALGLDPAVRFFQRRKVKRPLAILIVFLIFATVLGGVLWLVIPPVIQQIAQFINDLPRLANEFMASDFFRRVDSMFGDGLANLTDQAVGFLTNPSSLATIGGGALQAGIGIASGLSGALIVLVLSLYFLGSLKPMKQAFYRLAPAYSREQVSSMTDDITASIGGYVMGMVVLATCNSIFVLIMNLVLGLPFPTLMAVGAFFITLIPLIGTVLFWVIGSLVALFAGWLPALIFALAYLVYMQVEAYVLTPRVMSRAISIPGAMVVIGALVGGTLLGLLGALIAIPLTASILMIIKRVVIPKQDAKVEHPAQPGV